MRSVEFIAKAGKRLEIQEVDSNQNVFVCPALELEKHPYKGGRAVREYKVKIEYEAVPITEV
ncbi:MAG: hypothetical protein WC482_03875 [Candidatus Omnitrophota bacterium]|jgi:hypothetical protein|nr:hypothetical protein [Candidatus Omnitrophota bacterium]